MSSGNHDTSLEIIDNHIAYTLSLVTLMYVSEQGYLCLR